MTLLTHSPAMEATYQDHHTFTYRIYAKGEISSDLWRWVSIKSRFGGKQYIRGREE